MDLGFGYARIAKLLPTVISLGLLVQLWWKAELFGRAGILLCSWFVAATAVLFFTTSTTSWAIAVVAQTGLAILLLVKQRLTNM